MVYSAATPVVVRAPQAVPGVNAVQLALMWLAGISGSVVIIEPSPYELVVVASLAFFAITGLRLRMPFVPLMLFLFLINIGYTICAAYLMDQGKIVEQGPPKSVLFNPQLPRTREFLKHLQER